MNYRIDHLAFRAFDKKKAVQFFKDALGYREQAEFTIYFDEKKTETAICTALEPSDRTKSDVLIPWMKMVPLNHTYDAKGKITGTPEQKYVLSPEIFVSEGSEGSVVYNWCKQKGPGLHHIALQVPTGSSVEKEMERWIENGWAEEGFSSDVIKCNDLCQVFTRPSSILGVVFELIERKEAGFCKDSVRTLMESSRGD